MKGKKTQRGIHVYLKFGKNKHIHEAKHINMKNMYKMGIQVKMYESSKLGYTSTSNEYK